MEEVSAMKIRVKFKRWGVMKFIGHLDLMRYFQKAVRRAEIDICYSEGFSPHQIMSFAAPLGVGITSDGEYFDIEVNSTLSSVDAIRAFNDTMVDGIEVTGYVKLPDNSKTAMSLVEAAKYKLYYKNGYESPYSLEEWKKIIDEKFNSKSEFNIIKKTKKSEREINLRPLVYDFNAKEEDGTICFDIMISTGSNDNIKPELLLSSLYDSCNIEYDANAIAIHRIDVFAKDAESGNFFTLLDLGEEI